MAVRVSILTIKANYCFCFGMNMNICWPRYYHCICRYRFSKMETLFVADVNTANETYLIIQEKSIAIYCKI